MLVWHDITNHWFSHIKQEHLSHHSPYSMCSMCGLINDYMWIKAYITFLHHIKWLCLFRRFIWITFTISLWTFCNVQFWWNGLSVDGHKSHSFQYKYLHLGFEDEQKSYGFGMTWERVNYTHQFLMNYPSKFSFVLAWEDSQYINNTHYMDSGYVKIIQDFYFCVL